MLRREVIHFIRVMVVSRTQNIDVLFASLKNAKQMLPSVSTVEFQDGKKLMSSSSSLFPNCETCCKPQHL